MLLLLLLLLVAEPRFLCAFHIMLWSLQIPNTNEKKKLNEIKVEAPEKIHSTTTAKDERADIHTHTFGRSSTRHTFPEKRERERERKRKKKAKLELSK